MFKPETILELHERKKKLILLQEKAIFNNDEIRALSYSQTIRELTFRILDKAEIILNSK